MSGARKQSRPTAATFPALREFVAAYWHEDVIQEYGSAAAAARAFCRDAAARDLALVREEWARWQADHAPLALERKRTALRQLGSAWQPRTEADLEAVRKALAGRSSRA